MKPHEKILKMIEEVDHKDTATLDEIDVKVWCYYERIKFIRWANRVERCYFIVETKEFPSGIDLDFGIVKRYTRSRDAIKCIRPMYAAVSIYANIGIGDISSICELSMSDDLEWKSKELPTEELAELHAIIQAIAYERGE